MIIIKRFKLIVSILLSVVIVQILQGCGGRNDEVNINTKETVDKNSIQIEDKVNASYPEEQFILGSRYLLGVGVANDKVKAIEWLNKSAEQENVNAQDLLGVIYKFGEKGIPKNSSKALRWLEKASKQGDTAAQIDLGTMYRTGDGVNKNIEKAEYWWIKAAKNGSSKALFNLGLLHISENDVPINLIRSYAWLSLATEQGNNQANIILSKVKDRMDQKQIIDGQHMVSNWKEGGTLLSNSKYFLSNYFINKTGQIYPNSMANKENFVPSGNIENTLAKSKERTGTAFIVSHEGHALTSQHVINGCKEIRISGSIGATKIIASDSNINLALLQLPFNSPRAKISLSTNSLLQGKEIIIFGYPPNSVFSSNTVHTLGRIVSTINADNIVNKILITAPVQLSSSGSPILDKKANVIGMLSKNPVNSIKDVKSIPKNIVYVVDSQTIVKFLDTNNVPYKARSMINLFFSQEKNHFTIAKKARRWTEIVECWN